MFRACLVLALAVDGQIPDANNVESQPYLETLYRALTSYMAHINHANYSVVDVFATREVEDLRDKLEEYIDVGTLEERV